MDTILCRRSRFLAVAFLATISMLMCSPRRSVADDGQPPAPGPLSAEVSLVKWVVIPQADAANRTDVWGARATAGLRLPGRIWFDARVDVSALAGEFEFGDPGTYKAVEGYVGFHRPFALGSIEVAPTAIVGRVWAFDDPRPAEGGTGESEVALAGVRLKSAAAARAWVYLGAGVHRPSGPGARLLATAHLPVGAFSLELDYVGGEGGFVRAGIGVAVPGI